jgi:hypothetical protein
MDPDDLESIFWDVLPMLDAYIKNLGRERSSIFRDFRFAERELARHDREVDGRKAQQAAYRKRLQVAVDALSKDGPYRSALSGENGQKLTYELVVPNRVREKLLADPTTYIDSVTILPPKNNKHVAANIAIKGPLTAVRLPPHFMDSLISASGGGAGGWGVDLNRLGCFWTMAFASEGGVDKLDALDPDDDVSADTLVALLGQRQYFKKQVDDSGNVVREKSGNVVRYKLDPPQANVFRGNPKDHDPPNHS